MIPILLLLIPIIVLISILRLFAKLKILESYIDDLYDENFELWDSQFELEEKLEAKITKKK